MQLYESRKTETGVYATVSYSWGSSQHRRITTERGHKEKTVEKRCQGLELVEFPQTLQDAIHIARRLSFGYLWIASMCIVQNNDNDRNRESAAMTQIYGGSRLNNSASSSKNSDSGIFRLKKILV